MGSLGAQRGVTRWIIEGAMLTTHLTHDAFDPLTPFREFGGHLFVTARQRRRRRRRRQVCFLFSSSSSSRTRLLILVVSNIALSSCSSSSSSIIRVILPPTLPLADAPTLALALRPELSFVQPLQPRMISQYPNVQSPNRVQLLKDSRIRGRGRCSSSSSFSCST